MTLQTLVSGLETSAVLASPGSYKTPMALVAWIHGCSPAHPALALWLSLSTPRHPSLPGGKPAILQARFSRNQLLSEHQQPGISLAKLPHALFPRGLLPYLPCWFQLLGGKNHLSTPHRPPSRTFLWEGSGEAVAKRKKGLPENQASESPSVRESRQGWW